MQLPFRAYKNLFPPAEPAEANAAYFVRETEDDPVDLYLTDVNGNLSTVITDQRIIDLVMPLLDTLDVDGKQASSEKDTQNGYVGLSTWRINFRNLANTFTSFLRNSNTAARTYTFPDRSGTIADDTDIAGRMPLSYLDTDGSLTANSDGKVASQKATKTLVSTREPTANKATDFSTVNDTLFPSLQAVDNRIDSKITGLWNDRGNYNASGNTFPASGGSGSGGGVKKGNVWLISVGGTLGGTTVNAGDFVRALQDSPGQTAGNWAIGESNLGYTPESTANKDSSNGYAGLTLLKINFWNALGTFKSFFTNANTAARTYTFQDRDGTIADNTDIANRQPLDADLTAIAALSTTSFGRSVLELANAAAMRTLAGLGTIATLTAPSGTVVGTTDAQTLTNKKIDPRVLALSANAAAPAINTDNYDMVVITGQTANITSLTTNLTGTPANGQKLWIAFTASSGTPTVAYGASFEDSTITAPTSISSTRIDVGFVWNAAASKWRCVGKA